MSVSRRQEKIDLRKAEQKSFIQQRRKMQLAAFELGVKLGNEFYLANKEGMTAEEQSLIEKEIVENDQLLEKLRREANGEI
jgi:hypothetical protein